MAALSRRPGSLFERGSLVLGRGRATPVRVHWSAPVGVVALGGFALDPRVWAGVVALMAVHLAGHALFVRGAGARVGAVHVHGLGGDCPPSAEVSQVARAVVALGGVAANALVAVGLAAALALHPTRDATRALLAQLAAANLWLLGLNLLPLPSLDGWSAGALPLRLLERWLYRREAARLRQRLDAAPAHLDAPRIVVTAPKQPESRPEPRPAALHEEPDAADDVPPEVVAFVDHILEEARRDCKREKN